MKGGRCVIFLLAMSAAYPQTVPTTGRSTESRHRHGPDGLEGWTLNFTIPGHASDRYPEELVLARHGRTVRRISGDPFVWNWIFWAEGHQIAYETGPLHFGMLCNLADIATGRELASYDCFHEPPANAPEWEKALLAAQ